MHLSGDVAETELRLNAVRGSAEARAALNSRGPGVLSSSAVPPLALAGPFWLPMKVMAQLNDLGFGAMPNALVA